MRLALRLPFRHSLRAEAAAASVIVTALALVAAVALRWSVRENRARTWWELHTREVIGRAETVARDAVDAQSGLRGYLLLRGPAQLEQLYTAVEAFRRDGAALAAAVSDNPTQTARARRIREEFEAWHASRAGPLVAASSGAPDQARAAGSPPRMERVRALVDELIQAEAQLLEDRGRASAEAAHRLELLSLLATVAVVLVCCAGAISFALRVRRELGELTAAADAIAGGELGRRVHLSRDDDVGRVGRAFNAMAAQLEERQRQEEALRRMRELLDAAADAQDVQAIAARAAPPCLDGAAAVVYLIQDDRAALHPAPGAAQGAIPARACWAVRLGRAHVASEAGGLSCAHCTPAGGPALCLPLSAQGETVGVLHLDLARAGNPRLACEVAGMIALSLAALRMRETLRWQATRDGLTGLFNRRYLDETLAREAARAARTGAPLAAVLIDLDHFKPFNDTHGHLAGDALLKEVAAALGGAFRGGDVVCRYGGEEFLALLPGCGADEAARRAEAVRAAVRGLSILHDGAVLEPVSLSAGVATLPPGVVDGQALLDAADRALYRAKRDGRDRVVVEGSRDRAVRLA